MENTHEAICGGKLYVHRIYNGKDKPTAVCGNYAKAYDKLSVAQVKCESGHRIDTATVMELIRDKAGFIKSVQETLAAQQTNEIKKQKKRLVVCKKRSAELETLFRKIYEDNALGKLPDKRYEALASDYGKEQDALDKEIAELEAAVGSYEDGSVRAKRFIELVNRYTDFTELTIPMLNEFVNKIIIHERDQKRQIQSTQKVEIHLNFIGEYLPPTLTAEPLKSEDEEELCKVLERREKFRQAYLKRKASGKQQAYDRRYRERHNARIAANRAAVLADGAVLGASALAPVVSR